ncbi:MAG: tRNA (N(6)-L-threonylcarbamoyladenosine(37)-C(2))-methylthiotransferase MtaB [Anaerolineales bacterium]|nr:tRNA (N(6)-L-threonylcarbamoyladenosine(37)-C(2))-methylthiotransferase MtaB [Anaerolineales bacterium]
MKVYLDTIGCRLNQSEIEKFAREFRAMGHDLVDLPEKADLVVINTCTVTAAAASDSRQKIRQASRAGVGEILVTGCWSTLNPREAIQLPSVARVIANNKKEKLVADYLQIDARDIDLEPVARLPIPGARQRTRAFIKVQDGCDNRCTYCITTVARGKGQSLPIDHVLADIQAALAGGAQEIVITGVHLGSWGRDLSPKLTLRHLVQTVLADTDTPRLRLSSIEPWDLDADFFSLWGDQRLCRHLHLPLQSGSSGTLQRMARSTTPESFARLVNDARRIIPDVAITTDVIVGFPGETEAEFAESLAFIRGMNFARGHVFTYSARPHTEAARMPRQISHSIQKARNAKVRSVLAEAAIEYQQKNLGKELSVLWERSQPIDDRCWKHDGLSDNYLRISANTSQNLWNRITPVHLQRIDSQTIIGQVLE